MKKVFLQSSFIAILLLIVTSTFLNSCKKNDDNNNVTPVVTILPANTSTFTISGTQYSGACDSTQDIGQGGALGNIDVVLSSDSFSNVFIVYNMPKQSSGTYTFTNGSANNAGSALYALVNLNGAISYSTGGTIKKTGTNSFTFSCQIANYSNSTIITATGQGTY